MEDPKPKQVFDELRRTNVFCDAVLKVGKWKFPVHKVILCSSSDYFRAMFERCDHHQGREFTVGEISPGIMSLVLDFIYTGSTRLFRDVVQDLARTANMLLLRDLVKVCFEHMECHMCSEDCISIWKISETLNSPTTRSLAWHYILNNFKKVTATTDFLEHITAQELMSIIETDGLVVKNESAVFEVIQNWTNHDLESRRAMVPQLFTKMSISYIHRKVLHNDLVESTIDRVNAVARSMEAGFWVNVKGMNRDPTVRPRLPDALLLAIGGCGGSNSTNIIEAYNYKANDWVDITDYQDYPRAFHGSVFFNGSIYCVGGFSRSEYFNGMQRLDLSTHIWHKMPPMYHRRCFVSVGLLHDCIYALGGYNGHVRLRAAEVYDSTTNRWSEIANMNEIRSNANCAALNNKIYICGGVNGTEGLQTAECYCPETNQWTTIAQMSTDRSGVGVIAYANQIFAVRGFNGRNHLRSVEAYNPATNRWQEVADMHTARSNFGIEVMDGRIFVVGGFYGASSTNEVESYDPQLNTWTRVRGLSASRSALSCCVISGLPNMSEYTGDLDNLPLPLFEAEESDVEELV